MRTWNGDALNNVRYCFVWTFLISLRYLFIVPFLFSAMNTPLLLLVVVAVMPLLLLLFVSGVIHIFSVIFARTQYILFHTFLCFALCVVFLCALVMLLDIFGRAKWKNSSHRRRHQRCLVYDGEIRWYNNFCRWYFLSSWVFFRYSCAFTKHHTLFRYASMNARECATPHFWICFYIFSYFCCCCWASAHSFLFL